MIKEPTLEFLVQCMFCPLPITKVADVSPVESGMQGAVVEAVAMPGSRSPGAGPGVSPSPLCMHNLCTCAVRH